MSPWPTTRPPAIDACALSWREIYERGAFFQRELVAANKLRDMLRERAVRGAWQTLPWRDWDAEGAVRPIAFATAPYISGASAPAVPSNELVFAEERPAGDAWDDYAFDVHGHPHIAERYSPWQVLPLVVVLAELTVPVPVSTMLDPGKRETWATAMQQILELRAQHWAHWHERWEPTIKALVRLQNRYWPWVHGRGNLLTDFETGEHYDPEDRMPIDPHAALAELGLSKAHVVESYRFLARCGQNFEPGDRMHALRQMTSRRRRREFRGPARVAQDFYDAGEIFRRFYFDLTGVVMPDPEVVNEGHDDESIADHQKRRRRRWLGHEPRIRYDAGDLKKALVAHDLHPEAIHLLVEGDSEVRIATRLVEELLGSAYLDELVITDLRGVGEANRIDQLLSFVAEYSLRAVLIVDREGDMPAAVKRLVDEGLIDRADVLMFARSMEESNFSDGELVRIAKQLAATPTEKRPAGQLKLTGTQLSAYHEDRLSRLDPKANRPGLADSLVKMARRPEHGTITISKPELAEYLYDMLVREFDAARTDDDALRKLYRRRPILRHLIDRVIEPLVRVPMDRPRRVPLGPAGRAIGVASLRGCGPGRSRLRRAPARPGEPVGDQPGVGAGQRDARGGDRLVVALRRQCGVVRLRLGRHRRAEDEGERERQHAEERLRDAIRAAGGNRPVLDNRLAVWQGPTVSRPRSFVASSQNVCDQYKNDD